MRRPSFRRILASVLLVVTATCIAAMPAFGIPPSHVLFLGGFLAFVITAAAFVGILALCAFAAIGGAIVAAGLPETPPTRT